MSEASLYRVIAGYVEKLPGAVKETGHLYSLDSPHSLQATTATLLGAGVNIREVRELLGHGHITTTQNYDKRRHTTKEADSHDVLI